MKKYGYAKRILCTVFCVVVILSFTGCGAGHGTWNMDDGFSINNQASGSNAVVITMTWWGGQTRHDQTHAVCDLYTSQHPNVQFELLPSGWDGYFDRLATQTASGSMPDIVQLDYQYLTTYARNGSLTDLQPFIDNGTIDVSNIDAELLQTGKAADKMAAIVLSSGMLSVGYNLDVLVEAGVEEPTSAWTWDDFLEMCSTVYEKTGKYGISMDSVADMNIYHYWIRQHGAELFSDDNRALGYTDDRIFVDFVNMWNNLMDEGAMPDPDMYAQIATLGQETGPVVTGDAASIFEWNNYASKVSSVNDRIKMVTPPLFDSSEAKGLWMKPGMFFAVAETSKVKQEAAAFISWFINSREANEIMMAERGTPVSPAIRQYLIDSGSMGAQQTAMFEEIAGAKELCGETPPPEPAGISEINEAFKRAANSVYYGQATAERAAEMFRREAEAILAKND